MRTKRLARAAAVTLVGAVMYAALELLARLAPELSVAFRRPSDWRKR